MAFKIVLSLRAVDDIDEAVAYIAQDSVRSAKKWKNELEQLIKSLTEMPERFSEIPEAQKLRKVYRSALHHSHRVIFRIDGSSQTVNIIRIYPESRKPLKKGEV